MNENDNKKSFDQLKKENSVFFNRPGWVPVGAEFIISFSQLSAELESLAKAEGIEDVVNSCIQYSLKTKSGYGFIFLPNNSHHLVDDISKKEDVVLKRPIPRISNELNTFIGKFSPDKMRYPFSANASKYKCIAIDLDRVFEFLFDVENRLYTKTYGQKATPVDIYITPKINREKNEVDAFSVVKKIRGTKKESLAPGKSFNI